MSPVNRPCRLCGRRHKQGTTLHHLIPRKCHSNKWFRKNYTREQMLETIEVCRECHRAIHRFVPDEKDLGREYHTVEALLGHPEIGKFIAWARKQR